MPGRYSSFGYRSITRCYQRVWSTLEFALRHEDLKTSKCLGWANDRSPLRGLGHWKLICSKSLACQIQIFDSDLTEIALKSDGIVIGVSCSEVCIVQAHHPTPRSSQWHWRAFVSCDRNRRSAPGRPLHRRMAGGAKPPGNVFSAR